LLTLGIHDGHISTACLAKNGKIRAVISEERLNRIKEWGGFPIKSIRECIRIANIKPEQIDGVGVVGIMKPTLPHRYHQPHFYKRIFAGMSRIFPNCIMRSNKWVKPTQIILSRLRNKEDIEEKLQGIGITSPIKYYEHHYLHAITAHLTAWLNTGKNLVITSDGSGDAVSASVNIAENKSIDRIVEISHYNSISELYTQITQFLGMKAMSHEYKVMGMAPYAKKDYALKTLDVLRKYFKIEDGSTAFTNISGNWKWQYLKALQKDLKGHRFDNIACAVQMLFEDIIYNWVKNCIAKTEINNLVLSGGSFMNVKANNIILNLPEVDKLFIFPSCGDESLAIGAALVKYLELGGDIIEPLGPIYFGSEYSDSEIAHTIKQYSGLKTTKIKDIDSHIGKELAKGNVIARFSGRMEFGARSLGNRSILADPRNREVVKKINEAIKNRDFWMPFAPSILEERAKDYIVNPKNFYAPYMIMAFPTKSKAHTDLIAALHPYDLTARPQVVRKDWNPGFHGVLKTFEEITGVGGVLNTSFNLHGEPIVCSPKDALETFVNSGLDALAMGPFYITKK
jgi:carbamoyltransferase